MSEIDIRGRQDLHPCRLCGGQIWQESVDVGVGMIYGPAWCEDCGMDPELADYFLPNYTQADIFRFWDSIGDPDACDHPEEILPF